ncbi:MAG: rubredoxin-like domain-containing protein [Promethearchaeota archaeon]
MCGYVTFREEPPHKCPICQAKQEMFGEIILGTNIQVR